MPRSEFLRSVKAQAFRRCCIEGVPHCEDCGMPIKGRAEFDHIISCGLGGDNSIENCQILCVACHKRKTHQEDRPVMAKADRQRKAHTIKHQPTMQSRGFNKAPRQNNATRPLNKPAAWRGDFV